jgi:hypothetical protein
MTDSDASLRSALDAIGEQEPRSRDAAIQAVLDRIAACRVDIRFTTPTKVTKHIESVAQLFAMTSAGVPYSIGEHTKRVMRQYEALRTKHALHADGPVSASEFRLMLTFHDIGKGMTVLKSRGQSKDQHSDTMRVIDAIAPSLGEFADVLPRLRAAIDGDPLGEFLRVSDRQRRNPALAAKAIRAMHAKARSDAHTPAPLDVRAFYRELVLPFYACDAFSYGDASAGNGANAKDWSKKLAAQGYAALVRELGAIDTAIGVG